MYYILTLQHNRKGTKLMYDVLSEYNTVMLG
jgi:hypothetical protein